LNIDHSYSPRSGRWKNGGVRFTRKSGSCGGFALLLDEVVLSARRQERFAFGTPPLFDLTRSGGGGDGPFCAPRISHASTRATAAAAAATAMP
jgi:hypothetical protein